MIKAEQGQGHHRHKEGQQKIETMEVDLTRSRFRQKFDKFGQVRSGQLQGYSLAPDPGQKSPAGSGQKQAQGQ